MSTAKLSKPDDYTGEDKDLDPEVLEAWLDTMEDYLTLTKTTDVAEQVSTAAMYLKKTARRWYRTNKASVTTFEIMKTKIRDHFIPANYRTQLMLQWDSLKQDKKSVSDFVLDIRSLADKLDKDTESRTHRLLFGINPGIRKFLIAQSGGILAQGETEFDVLSRRAMQLEQAEKIDRLVSVAVPAQPRRFNHVQSTAFTRTRPAPSVSTSTNSNTTRATTPPTMGRKVYIALTQAEKDHLQSVEGCFYCRKEHAGHMSMDCPERIAAEARKEARIKQELNYLSGRDEDESDSIDAYSPSSIIPPVVLPVQIDDTKVRALVDSGGSSNFISKKIIQCTRIQTSPTTPLLLHQALSLKPACITEQVVAKRVDLPSQEICIRQPTIFKVAPLATHDAILGMPFLSDNRLLIDAKARKLIPHQSTFPPSGYVRVSNAFMVERPPEGFARVGNAFMELCLLETDRDAEYARLDEEFKQEFKDVFSSRPSDKLPHPDVPKHRIILKDPNKPMNGRLLRVPRKYYAAMREFIMENIRSGHLRPSSSSIASGTFMVPKKDLGVRPRMVHDYGMLNENTVKDHTPLLRQDEILEPFVTAKVQGKIDMPESYYQTWMFPKDIHKTAHQDSVGLIRVGRHATGTVQCPSYIPTVHELGLTWIHWSLLF